jgi:cobalt-zinc-cadmium efflux system membrane fusion protein
MFSRAGSDAPRAVTAGLLLLLGVTGCNSRGSREADQAPPPATVQSDANPNLVHVKNPASFPLYSATAYVAPNILQVTGSVQPDISRTIPVISIASGRVVDIRARMGDFVHKGQLLMEVQSTDISGAFDNYLKAVNDEHLTHTALDRAKLLYSKGAIPQSQLEMAQDQEDDNIADLTAAKEQLNVLGLDPQNPSAAVKVYAPASGYIIAQNVTNAAAAGVTYSGSSTAFTIADLSHVWIICDVYENDLAQVHLGQEADIRLDAYPGKLFRGRISDIGAVLDPTIRTAKVRVEVDNPGTIMRVGMFATAQLYSRSDRTYTAVPSTAVLHLHDRDWVYEPEGNGDFRRVAVEAGDMLPNQMQEIRSGLNTGQQVAAEALTLQNTVDQ